MRESRVITEFWFEPSQGFDVRGSLTFSDPAKVRLDPDDGRLKLKLNSDFRYPTDADLSIRTRTVDAAAVRALELVEVFATTPEGTAVRVRIFDGASERFFDGATWAVAGPGDWNTVAEVNAALPAFDVLTSRRFGVVVNLETTDELVTPTVESVLVLWRGPIDWVEDLLVDSLVGMLQDELEVIEDLALPPLPSDSAEIALDDYTDEQSLEFVGADAVFDHDADPNHLVDLLVGYDVGTRVLTLSAAIPAGNRPFLRMTTKPAVAWDTNQDFTELARLPQLVLRDVHSITRSPYPPRSTAGIVRRDTGEAVEVPAPHRTSYEITLEVVVDRTKSQMSVHEAVARLLREGPSGEIGPFLRSVATDRRYRLQLIDEFRAVDPRLNSADVRTYEATFRILDAALNLSPAREAHAIQRMILGFSYVPADEAAAAIAAGAPIPSVDENIEVS